MKPERIGRFDINAIEGNAYIARDPTLGREVVLRVVERAPAPALALRREALPAPVMLDGFASLHEIGHDGDIVFAVFERLKGTPLVTWARGSGRTEPELATVFRDLAAKLAALHATGAAHGALDETSIVVAEGRVGIVDLGLAGLSGTRPTTSDGDEAAFRALWLRTLDTAKLRAPRALRHALTSARPMSAWAERPPRSRRARNIGIGVVGAAVLAAGAWGIARQRSQHSSSPSAPSAPLTTTTLVDFEGCSADPMFSDDDTLVFSHLGDRKSGLYALDLGGTPRWLWDGPRREMSLQPAGLPNKVLFLTDHIEQIDAVTGVHADVPQPFDYFLSPFVIGTAGGSVSEAFYYIAAAGRSLYRYEGKQAREVATLPAGEVVYHDAISADGGTISLSAARGIYAVDLTRTPATAERLPTRRTAYQRAPVARGGRVIYYPNVDGISRFDRTTGTDEVLVPGVSAAGGLALSPDGRTLVGSTCQSFGTAIDTSDPNSRVLFREALDWPALAADGSWLYALNLPSGPIAARRYPDGRVIQLSKPELGTALTPTLSPDGREVAFAIDGLEAGIYLVPADGSAPPRRVAPDGGHYPMWLPDGRLAFARADASGTVKLHAIPRDGGAPVAIHPRSRRLATVLPASGEVLLVDGTFTNLWMWNPATGDERAITIGEGLATEALAVVRASPDGRFALVTTGLLNNVWRIDLRDNTPPARLHTGDLNELAGALYLPDGHEVLIRNTPRGTLWRVDLQ